ncbi:MAG: type II toxin-antitoxin system RatA family toxin [Pseudomonadota bacterium]
MPQLSDLRRRLARAAPSTCLALALACPGLAAAQPVLETRLAPGLVTVSGHLEVPVERTRAWQVLTQPDRFPVFVPGLKTSRTLEQHGTTRLIAQTGELTAGPRLRFDTVVRSDEIAGEGVKLQFLSGPFKNSSGEWRLRGERPVTLTYQLRVDLTQSPLPPPLAGQIADQQVRVWLNALAGEMLRATMP